MAIEYGLEFEAVLDPHVLLVRVCDISGLQLTERGAVRDEESGMSFNAWLEDDEEDIKHSEEVFGFRPRVCLYLTHGKKMYERDHETMMKTVAVLLKEITGGVALYFDDVSRLVLKRTGQEILLSKKWKDIPGVDYLDQVGLNYSIVTFES